ncbi:MAG: endonuclease [Prevotellaceae bacterium]|jgi:hypothetical protein|nr:endonuclease [Prevotellaceae bacterium]
MKKIFCSAAITLLLTASTGLRASVPIGYYYLADGKQKDALKTALATIASRANMLSYGSGEGFTWQGFYQTDRNNDNSVIDMYSDEVRYFTGTSAAVSGMHIEHSLPKSWWGSYANNAYKDLYHLYPADGAANSVKSNLPLGVVGTASFSNGKSRVGANIFAGYTGNCFEPDDEYKGDFARSYLYISTVYENLAAQWSSPMMMNNTYPVWQAWAIKLLLQWHRDDPVSQKEMDRAEAIYAIQGNRNPFIDYPNLVEYIWGADTLNTYHFPQETRPFLVSPSRWDKIDFGAGMLHVAVSASIDILGKNLTKPLQLTIKNHTSQLELSTSTVSVAAASAGTTLTLTFNASAVGVTTDTLLIFGGGLSDTCAVPISGIASRDFMSLEAADITSTSASLQWMNYPAATGYQIDVSSGATQAGDIFLSACLEGSSWNKAIAIYNGTGQTVDLSKYSLRKQNNGLGAFIGNYPLNGTLPDGQTCVIVHEAADPQLLALADMVTTASSSQFNILSFNGNDAVALYHEGIMIDVVGEVNNQDNWGEDITLKRLSSVTHPTTQFNWSEWTTLGTDDFSALPAHTMSGTASTLINQYTATTNSYLITGLMPSSAYIYRTSALLAGGSVAAVNSVQFTTTPLETPEALSPTYIHETGFTANWEETPIATAYLLDVFYWTASGTQTFSEGFDDVGSNGKPLPAGWTGTASGNYTSTASSGVAIPSVSLKNNGEWLAVTYPSTISELSFMYRYPTSTAAGSYLTVEAANGGLWNTVDTLYYESTGKKTAHYTFKTTDNYRQFRFTYDKKGSGNLAFDDVVAVSYPDTVFVLHNQTVTGGSFPVTGLTLGQTYFYRVKTVYSSALSAWSEAMQVTTQEPVNTNIQNRDDFAAIRVYTTADGIHITGAPAKSVLKLYTVTGLCLLQQTLFSPEEFVPMAQKGLYILRIALPSGNSHTVKIAR